MTVTGKEDPFSERCHQLELPNLLLRIFDDGTVYDEQAAEVNFKWTLKGDKISIDIDKMGTICVLPNRIKPALDIPTLAPKLGFAGENRLDVIPVAVKNNYLT